MNQPPPLVDYDLFAQDRPLVEALRREGGGAYEERLACSAREALECLGGNGYVEDPSCRGSSARAR